MPANLPPQAKRKWAEVSATKNPQQKIELMQEFLGLVPKHKGTEKLCGQVKRQIAILKREIEEKKRKRAGKGGPKFFIGKEGAAQIVVLGLTKVGRSSLLASITNAKVEVSNYPYTTREPVPGMFQYEDLQFQIVEAPALMKSSAEGEGWGLQTLGLARNADGLILMVDLSEDAREQLSLILNELEEARILTKKPRARVDIERKHFGVGLRILVLGRLIDCTMRDVEELLKSYRISDGTVKISGEATLDDVEDAVLESTVYRPALIVANKTDAPKAVDNLKDLEAFVGDQMRIIPISCRDKTGLEKLGREIFESLGIVRIYTREPNEREPSKKPFILKKGTTVLELAKQIHSDFYERFSYAKVWAKHHQNGEGSNRRRRLHFNGQKVGPDFPLEDGDIVELHMKRL